MRTAAAAVKFNDARDITLDDRYLVTRKLTIKVAARIGRSARALNPLPPVVELHVSEPREG